MRSRSVMLVLVLLCGSWQVVCGQAGQGRLAKIMPRLSGALQKSALTVAAGGVLLLGTLPAFAQDDAAEEANAAWFPQLTREVYNSTFYLLLRNPDGEHTHHVVYIGDSSAGEPLFVGIYLPGHEEDDVTLYGSDGLIIDNTKQIDVEILRDPLDGYAEARIITLEGLVALPAEYEPVVAELFPLYRHGRRLDMVQYATKADTEEITALPLMQRTCEVVDPAGWANVGVGLHNCDHFVGTAASYFGAPIFDAASGHLVAFHRGKSRTANQGAGVTQQLIDYIANLHIPASVDSKGKLPTTWAAIKANF